MEKVGKVLGNSYRQPRVASSDDEQKRPSASNHKAFHRAGAQSIGQSSAKPLVEASADKTTVTPRRRRRLGVRTDLTKVRAILSTVLAHRGLDKRVERYEFILHWPEIVGERLAEVSRPEYIRDKALIVQVLHPAWAQELTMIKPVLLESLARYLKPGDIVRDMVFRVSSFDRVHA